MNIKKSFTLAVLIGLLLPQLSFAIDQKTAVSTYKVELVSIGLDEKTASEKASDEGDGLLELMKNAQYDTKVAYDSLDTHVGSLSKTDGRREEALKSLDDAKKKVDTFSKLEPENEFDVLKAQAGALPRLLPTNTFNEAQTNATEALSAVNRILIAPDRPGNVPQGDIVNDFIPQIIRQLFRFAWLVVLISLIVSGVFFILAKDNEERVTNAKSIIYYSLIGFAIVALAFAIVKALTNIDFFGFI